jgi:hypothetical protein
VGEGGGEGVSSAKQSKTRSLVQEYRIERQQVACSRQQTADKRQQITGHREKTGSRQQAEDNR